MLDFLTQPLQILKQRCEQLEHDTYKSRENSFEKEKIGLINEEEDSQRRVRNIATELVDGFSVNEDEDFTNNGKFNRRKGSNYVGSSAVNFGPTGGFFDDINGQIDDIGDDNIANKITELEVNFTKVDTKIEVIEGKVTDGEIERANLD